MNRPLVSVLQVGDDIRIEGRAHTILAMTGSAVRLANTTGEASMWQLSGLLANPTLELLAASRPPMPPMGLLEAVPPEIVERARWWEQHLVEVITGVPPESKTGGKPYSRYDVRTTSLRQREMAKIEELCEAGSAINLKTLQRLRRNYERRGVWGLFDARYSRSEKPLGKTDPRVLAAIEKAIADETHASTGTAARLRRRVQQILMAEHGPDVVPMPSNATFYRAVRNLAEGKHTLGSARTRRSLAKQPEGPFGTVTAARPGEWTQIDSTPLDVRVVHEDGLVDRAELTTLVDLCTRTIGAAVLRPTTKAVDAALLLARAASPEPMRPGWADALRMSRSVLPHTSLVEVDQRLADAVARPVIIPETIVFDHGKAYLSDTFRSACCALGINFQPAHPDTPTDKPVVERTLQSIATLFAQYVAGYVGSSVERRGTRAEQDAVWSIIELQALLDEWIVAVWQNRPHEGLRDPLTPDRVLTPNERYAAAVAVAGYAPVALSADDYIELLPVAWRTINSYGIKINRRTYDAKALNPYRRQHSGMNTQGGQWECHYDPYDVSRIWVRNHHDDGWLTATWTYLHTAPMPFGEAAWQHARSLVEQRNQDPVTEEEIAQAARDLLDRAEGGPDGQRTPATKKDRRVVGRTRSTAPTEPLPLPPTAADAEDGPVDEHDDIDSALNSADELVERRRAAAKVIPLPVFDARKEAEKWPY